ncbi:uncharacterized protein LOC132545701 [Ylistrum balloti]|uniref:uncharacterized protein LOC132545701 n=1 Tax=Ylistrum balloti TaxID=509963 RepID=UPI0029059141|nr:uncharacterized protein LOC132545701 [Ylistrum balloti]
MYRYNTVFISAYRSGEEDKVESNDGGQPVLNSILKRSTANVKNEVIPEKHIPFAQHLNKKRVQNFANLQDSKRQKQDPQNMKQARQKQRAPLPPNVGSRTYNPAPMSAPSNRKAVPQQYVYLQQPGGSTRRYPPGYQSSRPQSAQNHVRNSRTLPPYRIVPPQFELLRMDDNSPQIRLGRYRPKVIQEHFSPNNIRDADFRNKAREETTAKKRKPVQTHTWEKQDKSEDKVNMNVQNGNTSTMRTKTIVRLKAPPGQTQDNLQWRSQSTHKSSVTIPPNSSRSTEDDDNGNYVIVDYVVDNLSPKLLQMKLTENSESTLQTKDPTNRLPNNELISRSTHSNVNSGMTTLIPTGSDNGAEMIETQKQILQQRQSEVSLAQLPISETVLYAPDNTRF